MAKVLTFTLMAALFVYSVSAQCDYCSDCCCEYSDGYDECCSCDSIAITWWGWTFIIVGILLVIIFAVSIGVWRRRVYMRRYTIVSQVSSTPVVVTTQTSTTRGPGYVSF